MKIIVASHNPVKLNATRYGFEEVYKDSVISIKGVSVSSGVADQPLTDEETLRGATNRAKNALKHSPKADYWVGLEGGVDAIRRDMHSFAWVVVMDKKGNLGKSRTASFIVPPKAADQIEAGGELGPVMDDIHGLDNVKQKQGAIGLMTDNLITREDLYIPAVIIALKSLQKLA